MPNASTAWAHGQIAVAFFERAQLEDSFCDVTFALLTLAAEVVTDAFDEILTALAGCVVVGHYVGFDLAMLAGEARRNGRDWREPPCFDTFELLGGLGLAADNVDLADILARLGIEPKGARHSAAGDARMAADLFVALARKLIGQGRGTFGGAMAAHRTPRR